MEYGNLDDLPDMSSTNVCRNAPVNTGGVSGGMNWTSTRNIGLGLIIIGMTIFLYALIPGIVLVASEQRSKIEKMLHLSNRQKAGVVSLFIFTALIAWCPWMTNDYAETAVIESLGGPNATYLYLGENLTIDEIPIHSVKVPFGIFVYFPGEAMYIVHFWGGVLGAPSLGLGTYGD